MEVVLAAVVTAVGSVIVVLIQKMRNENTAQHAEGRAILHEVREDVRDTRADVRTIKEDVRELDGRVTDLERP